MFFEDEVFANLLLKNVEFCCLLASRSFCNGLNFGIFTWQKESVVVVGGAKEGSRVMETDTYRHILIAGFVRCYGHKCDHCAMV